MYFMIFHHINMVDSMIFHDQYDIHIILTFGEVHEKTIVTHSYNHRYNHNSP